MLIFDLKNYRNFFYNNILYYSTIYIYFIFIFELGYKN